MHGIVGLYRCSSPGLHPGHTTRGHQLPTVELQLAAQTTDSIVALGTAITADMPPQRPHGKGLSAPQLCCVQLVATVLSLRAANGVTSRAWNMIPLLAASVSASISRFQSSNSSGVVDSVLPSEEVLQAEARLVSRRHSTGGAAAAGAAGAVDTGYLPSSSKASLRLLLSNKSLRDAFLKLPREVDGTVQRKEVAAFMNKVLPKEDATSVLSNLRDGACD
jgi:hypothetical protein